MSTSRQPRNVDIAPGVAGPRRFESTESQIVSLSQNVAYRVKVGLVFSDERWQYICARLTVTEASGYPVTGQHLRRIKVDPLVQGAVLKRVSDRRRPASWPDDEPWGRVPPEGLRDEGPTDRTLRWVAHLHRVGHALGLGPAQYVAEQLGVPQSTAGRWITAARKITQRQEDME